MQLMRPDVDRICSEWQVYEPLLQLDGASILELGCGKAELTRHIATNGRDRRVLALEVDEAQHALNQRISDLPNVDFRLGGAEAIPVADGSMDIVLLFKSLHHVPVDLMPMALEEIRRVLRPGGLVYVSEPVFAGAFNDILQLFHNESRVRMAAFAALESAVASGRFELVEEIFFLAPQRFADFDAFERGVIGVTHTRHHLTPEVHAEVKRRFATHQTPTGALFHAPMRVDLLRRGA